MFQQRVFKFFIAFIFSVVGLIPQSSRADDLQDRIDELEHFMTNLTGRLERMEHQNKQLEQKISTISKDMNLRLQALEKENKKLNGRISSMPTASSQPQPPKVIDVQSAYDDGPENHYKRAKKWVDAQEYEKARQSFQDFIQKYPKHDLGGNAKYWIGETYYAKGEYEKAAVAFADGFRDYPKNVKAPDNMLKLGFTMINLNNEKQACIAFKHVAAAMPQASQGLKDKAKKEAENLTDCTF